jgi:RHH-type proline utilization regulon transcriptional repressor/proline dehydrogenase/delta 1-pyrroline-5-carboxylate dehydrogenase
VTSEKQADEFQARYLDMILKLAALLGPHKSGMNNIESGPRVNLSIKLSSLASSFDAMDWEGTAAAVLARLRPLFRAARTHHAFINVDMEKYEYRDMTLEILKRLLSEEEFRGYEHVGTVVQAYLNDAEEILDSLLAWIRESRQPMTLRLVKGAYWDSEQIWASQRGWPAPVLTDKRETDAQFERMTKRLLEHHSLVRTAIGSHNVRSIAHAMALRDAMGIGMDRFEVQMLYGMAGAIAPAVAGLGVPLRIYVPCGELVPGMAYLVRRILENTANESFLRQRFVEHADEDRLLADPKGASDG